MVLLSVLLPVRNGERFLPAALASTLRSMPADSELLVGDDGSDDDTPPILEKACADSRVRVLRSETGTGVASTLNRLLGASTGRYVARMDADDVSLPWRFSQLHAQLEADDLVFAAVINVNERLRPVAPDLPGPISSAAAPLHLLLGNVLRHPTLLARRSALERLGGYRHTFAEDYDLWLRAVASGLRIRRSARPALLYREHSGQVTSSARWNSPEEQSKFSAVFSEAFARTIGTEPSSAEYARHALSGTPGALPNPLRARLRQDLRTAGRRLRATDLALLRVRMRALR